MNDFLQSIRNSQKEKRQNKNRRHYDGNNDYNQVGNERRNGNDKRNRNGRLNPAHGGINHETMVAVKQLLVEITSIQKKQLEVENRRAVAEERKADALETMGKSIKALAEKVVPALLFNLPEDTSCQTADQIEPRLLMGTPEQPVVSDTDDFYPASNNPVPFSSADTPVSGPDRNEVVTIIRKMRAQGVTYDFIARQLTEQNIPTFSGRGVWHAQTIHRLCRKK
jgi:hypothetical protein